MKIMLNNLPTVIKSTTVEELHAELTLPDRGVAIAINNRVILRDNWSSATISEGDSVTVIKAAFGG